MCGRRPVPYIPPKGDRAAVCFRSDNAAVELRIVPEPTPEEREAIAAALERLGAGDAVPAPAWADPELGDEQGTASSGA